MLDVLLDGKFNWETFIEGAKRLGHQIASLDIENYFKDKYPPSSSESETKYFVQDEQKDEFRELSSGELELVSGGTTIVAVVVYVAAVVFQAAAIATFVYAGTAVAIGAGH